MTVILDIETENTGYDIMEHNKRIISIQIGDLTKQELYYADSSKPGTSLNRAEERIKELLDKNTIFSGYNITGFDVPMLKKFLDISIPTNNLMDLNTTQLVTNLCKQRNRRLRLEEICTHLNIGSTHKDEMNKKAESYKNRPELMSQAQEAAKEIVNRKGWSYNWTLEQTLNKIAGGHAINDSYNEFVANKGSENTLFYRYAIGDIISEYNLLARATQPYNSKGLK